MKTENNARLKYKIHQKRNMRLAECNNATPSLFHSNHSSDLQNSSSKKKRTNKHEKRVQQPRGPYKDLRSANGASFRCDSQPQRQQRRKSQSKENIKKRGKGRGWDYIVTFRVIFSYNVSYTSRSLV